MRLRDLAPVLYVDAIEPCLSFWCERLQFEIVTDFKPENDYVFVLLRHGDARVMLQRRDSVTSDMPSLTERDARTSIVLYFRVEKLDVVARALTGIEHTVPMRTTFYGAREFGVREPSGNVVVFSQHE